MEMTLLAENKDQSTHQGRSLDFFKSKKKRPQVILHMAFAEYQFKEQEMISRLYVVMEKKFRLYMRPVVNCTSYPL